MHPYLPVLIVLSVALVIGLVMSFLSAFFGPKVPSAVKQEVFECGVAPVGSRERMSVRFYLTAILFILFDIETVFLYLWARTFKSLGWFGIAEIFVFVAILVAGYIYVLKRKALEWD
jgi:NADH-quinone oxidoreductase subunit A